MKIFANSDNIISEVINRVLNCRQLTNLYIWGNVQQELDYLYSAIKVNNWDGSTVGEVVYLHVDMMEKWTLIEEWICNYRQTKDFIIYVPNEAKELADKLSQYGMAYPLKEISALEGSLFLIGLTFDRKEEWIPEDDFKVLAILHFYNEADVLDKTIEYLLGQNVDVYLLDNWSDDGSYEIACRLQENYPDRIYLEHFPEKGKTGEFELYKQMEATEFISKKMNYAWFIHYDADEIRITPWQDTSLKQALYWIDKLGYNCVENTVIDFKLTEIKQDNIFMTDTCFDFRHKFAWFNHLKTWKKTDEIDLKSTAGHTLRIRNPKVFPLKFLNKHYPFRTIEQAERKIFKERIPRFAKEKNTFGWHGHYDKYLADAGIIVDKRNLLKWNDEILGQLYIPLFMECGLQWDEDVLQVRVPSIKKKKIVVYGAGKMGKRLFAKISQQNKVVSWVDENAEFLPWMYATHIVKLKALDNDSFDYVIILIKNESVRNQIIKSLNAMNINENQILYLK